MLEISILDNHYVLLLILLYVESMNFYLFNEEEIHRLIYSEKSSPNSFKLEQYHMGKHHLAETIICCRRVGQIPIQLYKSGSCVLNKNSFPFLQHYQTVYDQHFQHFICQPALNRKCILTDRIMLCRNKNRKQSTSDS